MNISQRAILASGTQQLLDNQPERLFIGGFRCIMAGYDYADIGCWETAWTIYSSELDVVRARVLLGEMQYFVRVFRACHPRPLSLFPHSCRRLSHDESQILNLLVSLQQEDDTAAHAAADRILEGMLNEPSPEHVDSLIEACRGIARMFESQGQIFIPLGQDVLDQLTGGSNDICNQCPVTGAISIARIA